MVFESLPVDFQRVVELARLGNHRRIDACSARPASAVSWISVVRCFSDPRDYTGSFI